MGEKRRAHFWLGLASVAAAGLLLTARFLPVNWQVMGTSMRAPLLRPPQVDRWLSTQQQQPVVLRAAGRNWRFTPAALGMQLRVGQPPGLWDRMTGSRQLGTHILWDRQQAEATLRPLLQTLTHTASPARWSIPPGAQQPMIIPDVPGQSVDLDALFVRLQKWVELGSPAEPVRIPLLPLRASPTMEELEATGVDSLLATFTTRFDPTIPRGENVMRAAAALDGYWWQPDGILSYNGLVGPIRPDSGWQEAWVIVGDHLVRGVGGGVCQVATTLYDAALLAGLEVVERHPHNLAVSYIEPSRDATVAPPYQDLKLRNTTGHSLYIRAQARGGAVTIWIYGHAVAGRRIEVVTHVLTRRPFATREMTTDQAPVGKRIILQAGSDAITSTAWRMTYQDHTLVAAEELSHDTYEMAPRVIGVGSRSPG